jgi:hypothetical protein
MTDRLHFLPSNSTPLEQQIVLAGNRLPELAEGSDALHAFKLRAPIPESVLPWLIVEYGLGPVSAYLSDAATTILYGLPWSRLKGTPAGVLAALQWIGYAYDSFYEAPTRRTRWHLFEIELDRFWDREADLDIIEAVARLSEPARSPFWRGWREYNVREFEWAESRWGDAIWGDASGVRLHDGGAQWSFGRTHEPDGGSYLLTEADLDPLGLWIEPVEDAGLGWGPFPWNTPGLKWESSGVAARATAIFSGLLGKSFWIKLLRGDGSVIGCRKVRAKHCVTATFDGRYQVGAISYEPSVDYSPSLYVEAMTDFGEGYGETFASWSLVIDGALPAGSKPGLQWVAGDELVGGISIGSFPAAGVIGKTDRERFRGIFKV